MFKRFFKKNSKADDNPIEDKDSLLYQLKKYAQLGTKKILIVDDNELNANLFSDLLECHGYDTHHISEGHNALSIAYEFQPNLIVIDIQSQNISGFDVIQDIKSDETFKDTPIIAVTNSSITTDDKRWEDGSCDAYMTKPINVSLFTETISQILLRKD